MASSQVNPLKRKHTTLTLKTKLKLLSEIDNMGKTMKREIADNYGIPTNTLSTILKKREKMEKMASLSSVNLSKKWMRTSPVEDIDAGLYFSFLLSFSYKCPLFCNSNLLNSKFSCIPNQFEL